MRIFVEAREILPPDATEPPEFVRIDVTDMTQDQVKEVIELVKQLFAGKKYILYYHYCYHEERKPCRVEVIEVVQ